MWNHQLPVYVGFSRINAVLSPRKSICLKMGLLLSILYYYFEFLYAVGWVIRMLSSAPTVSISSLTGILGAWLNLELLQRNSQLNKQESLANAKVRVRQRCSSTPVPFYALAQGNRRENPHIPYIFWKLHSLGYIFCRWHYGSIFIRLAVVASQNAN